MRQIPDTVVHTHPEDHAPGIVNVGFAGVDGETLLLALPGWRYPAVLLVPRPVLSRLLSCVALGWPMNWLMRLCDSALGVLLSLGMWTPQVTGLLLRWVDCAALRHAYNVRPLKLPNSRFSSVFFLKINHIARSVSAWSRLAGDLYGC